MTRRPPRSTLFPYTPLSRSEVVDRGEAVGHPPGVGQHHRADRADRQLVPHEPEPRLARRAEQVQHELRREADPAEVQDRKSTRLNSSHLVISYAVFCLKQKN